MYLKYDSTSGNVTDAGGGLYFIATGLPSFNPDSLASKPAEPLSTKEVLALKEQGFDAKEIIEMRKEGVI